MEHRQAQRALQRIVRQALDRLHRLPFALEREEQSGIDAAPVDEQRAPRLELQGPRGAVTIKRIDIE